VHSAPVSAGIFLQLLVYGLTTWPPPRRGSIRRCSKLLAFALGAGVAGLAGAGFAQLFGYVEPSEFDFSVSLMVLAAVVLGGRWGITGAVFGALAIAAHDRLLVDGITAGLHTVGTGLHSSALLGVDLRQHNFAIFGAALFFATLYRARTPA